MTHYQTQLREQIGYTIARLYLKGAADLDVVRYCRIMHSRYLGACALIQIEAQLIDGEPRRNAREHNIIAAYEWRRTGRKVREGMAPRDDRQEKMHEGDAELAAAKPYVESLI